MIDKIDEADSDQNESDGLPGGLADSVSSGVDKPSTPGVAASGIFSGGLDVYRTVTDEDYRSLFASGLIVLDTNVLLNLYRYHADTRELLIQVLTRLKDRLWVPYQVMFEFLEKRTSVIADRSVEIERATSDLRKKRADLETIVRTWANRSGFPQGNTDELIISIRSTIEDVISKIREQGADDAFNNAEDTAQDPVVVSLYSILDQNVGAPLPADELREAKNEALQRIKDNRPPGWRDANKRDNPEGDYIIWYQTLQEAKRRRIDVLFVTGDVKPDWWRRERGEAKGPLPELAYEMLTIAGVRLFMLRPESLLIHAGNTLSIKVSSESVQDVQRVTVQTEIAWNVLALDSRVRDGVARLVRAMEALDNWSKGTDTYANLLQSVTNLDDATRSGDLQRLLAAVWVTVGAGIAMGIFGGIGPWRPSNWEAEVWAALDFVYVNAVQTWLEDAVEQYMRDNPISPVRTFNPGSLPPAIIGIDWGEELEGLSVNRGIEFVAAIRDGRRVVAHRIYGPKA